jgi:hypothetical protein
MTAGDPLAGPGDAPGAAAAVHDDTEACLCLVASYGKRAGLIARVTAEAEKLVEMSPMLGDFLQLRFVDLGLDPGQVGDRSRPIRRITAELRKAPCGAGRSHFALIVIDKSSRTIDELLGTCAAEPFLAGLRMRFAGIASRDDREAAGTAHIVSSPTGTWQDEGGLVDALRRQCEELPRYFVTRAEPGLTPAELAALRQAHGRPVPSAGSPFEGGLDSVPDDGPEPDVLDDADQTVLQPVRQLTGQPAGLATGSAGLDAPPAAGRHPLAGVSRWLPAIPRRERRRAAPAGEAFPAGDAVPAPKAMGLVHLLATGDPHAMGDHAIGRLQAVLLEVDKKLAARQPCAYQVRLVYGNDNELRGELRGAGLLGRRAAKRSVEAADFAALCKGVRTVLKSDGALVEAAAKAEGLTVARPAVVIFTSDPPMADRGSAAAFGDLAAEATVVWVVPRDSEGLVSPVFARGPGIAVKGEHHAVADDICRLLTGA